MPELVSTLLAPLSAGPPCWCPPCNLSPTPQPVTLQRPHWPCYSLPLSDSLSGSPLPLANTKILLTDQLELVCPLCSLHGAFACARPSPPHRSLGDSYCSSCRPWAQTPPPQGTPLASRYGFTFICVFPSTSIPASDWELLMVPAPTFYYLFTLYPASLCKCELFF